MLVELNLQILIFSNEPTVIVEINPYLNLEKGYCGNWAIWKFDGFLLNKLQPDESRFFVFLD